MGLLTRLMGREQPERRGGELAADARAMRRTLGALHGETKRLRGPDAPVDLRAIVRELLEGEVEAPSADIAWLVRTGIEASEFYESDVAPPWEGLGEAQRAARVEGFLELSTMMDAPGAAAGLPEGMVPRVHTKTLLLAFAFDETYGYLSALGRGEGL